MFKNFPPLSISWRYLDQVDTQDLTEIYSSAEEDSGYHLKKSFKLHERDKNLSSFY
jgi:hypothetical protein